MNIFAYWIILHPVCHLLIFFKVNFIENTFRNNIRFSNSLDPDQAKNFVGPDLGPNCFKAYQQATLVGNTPPGTPSTERNSREKISSLYQTLHAG